MRVMGAKQFWIALPPAVAFIGLATGLPSDVLPNPWFTRMTPVRPADVVVWVLVSGVLGGVLATYAVSWRYPSRSAGRAMGGGALSVLAIGCPVCNKLVVIALGVSGALSWFAPLQPFLGALAVAVSLLAFRTRLKDLDATAECTVTHPRGGSLAEGSP